MKPLIYLLATINTYLFGNYFLAFKYAKVVTDQYLFSLRSLSLRDAIVYKDVLNNSFTNRYKVSILVWSW